MTRDLTGPRPPRARLASSALVGLLILAKAVIACAPANTAPPPGAPAAWTSQSGAAPAPAATEGPRVLVSRGAYWMPARVVARTAEGFVVSYETNGPASIETVTLDRIRPIEAQPQPDAAALAPSFQVGEQVLVAAPSRKLFLAEVVQQVGPARYRIHYSGFGPEVAEDVGPERLRRPFSGASALAVSQPVWVLTGSQAMPARVVAVLGPASWLVRFDGYGPESDQEIGPERIVLQAPPQAALAASPAAALPAPPSALTAPGAPSSLASGAAGSLGAPGAPGAPASSAASTSIGTTSFTIGQEVLVEHRGVYHRATVVSVTPVAAVTSPAGAAGAGPINSTGAAAATVRVRYEPPGPPGEEDLAAARVRAAPAPGGGTPFQPGQAVLMEWRGLFFPAKVVKASGKGQYRLRFEGSGPEADEIVPARRLRPVGS